MNALRPYTRTNESMCEFTNECGCKPDPITVCCVSILGSLYGVVTCFECCSGECIDVCTYQRLPICQDSLEPDGESLDHLPEQTPQEIQQKLQAARAQLSQLDQTLNTRRKTHRCVSTLLCPFVFVPRCITCFIHSDDDHYDACSRPQPNTQLDLAYQWTLPWLQINERENRKGFLEFLSPPETQRMKDLTTIVWRLQDRGANS